MNYYHIDPSTLTVISGPHAIRSTYIKKLTNCGNPELLDLLQYNLVPEVYEPLAEGQKHGNQVVTAEAVTFPAIAKTAEDMAAETQAWRELAEVTPRQARLMLKRAGLLNGIKQMINGMDEEAQIEWEHATAFKRTHPLLVTVAAQAGLTDDQLDTMFRDAAGL